jgi:glycosyltransferase involved in cell wall biosynthesis
MPPDPSDGSERAPLAISVVICAFTTERLGVLAEAIASVREQSLVPHEIVLVIDHSPELLEKARELWPDLRIVENREVPGVSGSRNTGVAESSGDVVAFLDDDAIAHPGWLRRLADDYGDPRVLGVGGTVSPRWAERRPDWFPPEFDWVVGCTHSGMPKERTSVRNLVGANSSFRRPLLVELEGFRTELGRVESNPIGCEETDLCIRMGKQWPDGLILYDPDLHVSQVVPPRRSELRYFRARCVEEGRSKALLSELVGRDSGLSAEREYVRRTLPAGVLRGLADAVRGDAGGLARAGAIFLGLTATVFGYLRELARIRRTGVKELLHRVQPGDPLRVLMVTPRTPLVLGGVERHVMETSRRMAATGVDVTVLCAEPGGAPESSQTLDGVEIRAVRAWPGNADWRFAPGIWREIGRRRWDVVHVQSYHTFVAPLAMLRALSLRIPYLLTFHGGGHSSRLRNRLRRAQRAALRPLLARAKRLVAVARFEIDFYSRELRLPSERFALIPNGTDFTPAPAGAQENGDGRVVLATIGRLERYKGHHRVIEAFPHVLARHPDASLLVVGTGPYEPELRALAATLGLDERVEFTSVPANDSQAMATLLGATSLVVLLSDFETHPLTALEAAAAGRRLLVADRGGLAELAGDGYARAVDPEAAPAEVGEAILEVLSAPAPEGPPPLVSWDESTAALLALYRSVTGSSQAAG